MMDVSSSRILYLSVISTIVLLALVVTHSSLHIDQERLILLLVHHSAVVLLNPLLLTVFCVHVAPPQLYLKPQVDLRASGPWYQAQDNDPS